MNRAFMAWLFIILLPFETNSGPFLDRPLLSDLLSRGKECSLRILSITKSKFPNFAFMLSRLSSDSQTFEATKGMIALEKELSQQTTLLRKLERVREITSDLTSESWRRFERRYSRGDIIQTYQQVNRISKNKIRYEELTPNEQYRLRLFVECIAREVSLLSVRSSTDITEIWSSGLELKLLLVNSKGNPEQPSEATVEKLMTLYDLIRKKGYESEQSKALADATRKTVERWLSGSPRLYSTYLEVLTKVNGAVLPESLGMGEHDFKIYLIDIPQIKNIWKEQE